MCDATVKRDLAGTSHQNETFSRLCQAADVSPALQRTSAGGIREKKIGIKFSIMQNRVGVIHCCWMYVPTLHAFVLNLERKNITFFTRCLIIWTGEMIDGSKNHCLLHLLQLGKQVSTKQPFKFTHPCIACCEHRDKLAFNLVFHLSLQRVMQEG